MKNQAKKSSQENVQLINFQAYEIGKDHQIKVKGGGDGDIIVQDVVIG